MNVYSCTCGSTLFFENTQCLACQREVGWCPTCSAITAVESNTDNTLRCTKCEATLGKCYNYAVENVCNRFLPAEVANAEAKSDPNAAPDADALCRYCEYTVTIPNLANDGNRARWFRLEKGKRRLLYTLDYLGLAFGNEDDGIDPPLSFHFESNPGAELRNWQPVEGGQKVFTGHDRGRITINLREAEPAEREKLRVQFDEAHRTIIGHFRHEIAHYYWDMLVRNQCEDDFIGVFGDHNNPTYSDAMQQHYDNGPPADWAKQYVSAYATMHPWEDFAETFATYLDIVSVLETADNMGLGSIIDPRGSDLGPLVSRYQHIGLVLNEMNRDMGLKDLVPVIFVPPVVEKLRFIHQLVRNQASRKS